MKLKRKRHVNTDAHVRKDPTKRSPTWCRDCGRKHSKDDECNMIPTDRGGLQAVGGSTARMGRKIDS